MKNPPELTAAFPDQYQNGMTLRDYFAAKALPFALQECMCAEDYYVSSPAVLAYQYADAMLKAREA